MWFKKKPTAQIVVPKVQFLGEQDGPSERELKLKLEAVLGKEPTVESAYLARVAYGDDSLPNSVALGVVATDNRRHGKIADAVGKVFHHMWIKSQYLDVVFLSPEKQKEIAAVCKTFYSKSQK